MNNVSSSFSIIIFNIQTLRKLVNKRKPFIANEVSAPNLRNFDGDLIDT